MRWRVLFVLGLLLAPQLPRAQFNPGRSCFHTARNDTEENPDGRPYLQIGGMLSWVPEQPNTKNATLVFSESPNKDTITSPGASDFFFAYAAWSRHVNYKLGGLYNIHSSTTYLVNITICKDTGEFGTGSKYGLDSKDFYQVLGGCALEHIPGGRFDALLSPYGEDLTAAAADGLTDARNDDTSCPKPLMIVAGAAANMLLSGELAFFGFSPLAPASRWPAAAARAFFFNDSDVENTTQTLAVLYQHNPRELGSFEDSLLQGIGEYMPISCDGLDAPKDECADGFRDIGGLGDGDDGDGQFTGFCNETVRPDGTLPGLNPLIDESSRSDVVLEIGGCGAWGYGYCGGNYVYTPAHDLRTFCPQHRGNDHQPDEAVPSRRDLSMEVLFQHKLPNVRRSFASNKIAITADMDSLLTTCGLHRTDPNAEDGEFDGCSVDLMVGLGQDLQFKAFAAAFAVVSKEEGLGAPEAAVFVGGGVTTRTMVPEAEGLCGTVTWHPDMNFPGDPADKEKRYLGSSTDFVEYVQKSAANMDEMLGGGATKFFKQRMASAGGVSAAHAQASAGLVMLQMGLERAEDPKSPRSVADVIGGNLTSPGGKQKGLNADTFFGKLHPDSTGWNCRGGTLDGSNSCVGGVTVGVVQSIGGKLRLVGPSDLPHWSDGCERFSGPGPTNMAACKNSAPNCTWNGHNKHTTTPAGGMCRALRYPYPWVPPPPPPTPTPTPKPPTPPTPKPTPKPPAVSEGCDPNSCLNDENQTMRPCGPGEGPRSSGQRHLVCYSSSCFVGFWWRRPWVCGNDVNSVANVVCIAVGLAVAIWLFIKKCARRLGLARTEIEADPTDVLRLGMLGSMKLPDTNDVEQCATAARPPCYPHPTSLARGNSFGHSGAGLRVGAACRPRTCFSPVSGAGGS
eukprot:SAG11_NODE_774_length_7236_cov_2.593807_7_plen_904_part_00